MKGEFGGLKRVRLAFTVVALCVCGSRYWPLALTPLYPLPIRINCAHVALILCGALCGSSFIYALSVHKIPAVLVNTLVEKLLVV